MAALEPVLFVDEVADAFDDRGIVHTRTSSRSEPRTSSRDFLPVEG